VNRALLSTRPHVSKTISDAVRGCPDVIDLTVGVSDFGPPHRVRTALVEAAGPQADRSLDRYADARGLPALRDAIAERYLRRYGLRLPPASILVTHGAAEALWLAVLSFTNPGDEIVLLDPCYMLYASVVQALDRRAVRLPTRPEDGYRIDPRGLAEAITMRTALLILNSPANPTGAVQPVDTFRAVVETARARDVIVVHDEVFDDMVWSHPHIPALAFSDDSRGVVVVNSMSKRMGMTGWRLGWLAGDAELVEAALRAHTLSVLATCAPVQHAVSVALNDPETLVEIDRHGREMMHRVLEARAELSTLPGFELPGPEPGGGFYLFPRVRDVARDRRANETQGEAVARLLLERCRVALVPGIAFGPSGADHVRLSVAGSPALLGEALDRVRKTLTEMRRPAGLDSSR
jgi:aspartate/methionine/tyrosine aminotransferase